MQMKIIVQWKNKFLWKVHHGYVNIIWYYYKVAKILDEVVAYEISLNELNYDVAIKIESLMSSEDIV